MFGNSKKTEDKKKAMLDRTIENLTKKDEGISDDVEQSLKEMVDANRERLMNGELSHGEMVDMYMKLAGPHMSDKQKLKMKVKLIKLKKPVLEVMLKKAIEIAKV